MYLEHIRFLFHSSALQNLKLTLQREKSTTLPWQVNFFEGVVSRSLSAISPGPAQRAIPGSLYSDFTQSDSHCMLQSQ